MDTQQQELRQLVMESLSDPAALKAMAVASETETKKQLIEKITKDVKGMRNWSSKTLHMLYIMGDADLVLRAFEQYLTNQSVKELNEIALLGAE
jgi:hypothetical protein